MFAFPKSMRSLDDISWFLCFFTWTQAHDATGKGILVRLELNAGANRLISGTANFGHT